MSKSNFFMLVYARLQHKFKKLICCSILYLIIWIVQNNYSFAFSHLICSRREEKCRKITEGAERTWDKHRLWGQTEIANRDTYYLNRHSHSLVWHLVVTKMHGYNKILVTHSNRHLKPHVVIVTEHRYNKILQIRYLFRNQWRTSRFTSSPSFSGSKLGMHCSL